MTTLASLTGRIRPRRWPRVLPGLLLILAGLPWATAPARADAPPWQDARIVLPDTNPTLCFDATQPGLLLLAAYQASDLGPPGTYALDTVAGQVTRIADRYFSRCDESTGWLYTSDVAGQNAVRFSRAEPAGRPIAHYPTYLAPDGSGIAYAFEGGGERAPNRLWASVDAGLTWQERPAPPGGPLADVSISEADPRALVATTQTFDQPARQLSFRIYISLDGGTTWEQRYADRIPWSGFTGLSAAFLPGRIAPVDTVLLSIGNGIPGSNGGATYHLSADGARSFTAVGDWSISSLTQVLPTPDGLVRLRIPRDAGYSLTRSRDGGRTWEALPLPPFNVPHPPFAALTLVQAPAAPASLFLYNSRPIGDPSDLWYSADSGRHWEAIGPQPAALFVTPYMPLDAFRVDGQTRRLAFAAVPEAAHSLPAPVPPVGGAGSRYFPETGHNLAGPIRTYWETHGGLAQFGYPRTEAFREVSATDDHTYLVQYFERNRLEYHPEHAGTPFVVQLGLLGVQFTAGYRAQHHGAFNAFADAHYPGGLYFPETGHNLRNSFLASWQAHGGLAIHGYPISEEFYEVSPTDGGTYVVQYFQRSRFEWHPEHRGTPYEVQLGLLGNWLIEHQGWQ